MRIHLLRHAETLSNKTDLADSRIDSELSEEWLLQVESLKKAASGLNVDVVIVSPLRRTRDTVEPLLEALWIPPVYESELTLERDLGDFTWTKMGVFQKFCDDHGLDRVFQRPDNGESLFDAHKRAKRFLSYLEENFDGQNILVCGHKNFLMCFYILLTWGDLSKYYELPGFKNGELRTVKPCAIVGSGSAGEIAPV